MAEVQITTLIELLMRHAVKLESIPAVGDSYSQRNIQVHPHSLQGLRLLTSMTA